MLFQADLRGVRYPDIIEVEAKRAASEPDRVKSWLYAREIVDGVNDHAREIDEKIQTYAHDWSIERMPAVDRAILRMATWELLFSNDVDVPVAINEAVELAKEYSTDESAKYVNGVLGRISDYKRAL